MKRFALAIISIIIFSNCVFSQKGVVTGRLIAQSDSLPVEGAAIIWFGTTLGVKSDERGYFEFKKLKTKNTELMIEGSFKDRSRDFYLLSLRNIELTKKNPAFDVGTIALIERYTISSAEELPYIEIDSNKYFYSLVDGADRRSDDYILIDFSKPNEKGTFKPLPKSNSLPSIVDYRYPGGTLALRKFLGMNMDYPPSAVENAIVGFSLSSCTINPDGSIKEVSIINPVNPSIDSAMSEVLYMTEGRWKTTEKDTLETFYVQVVFSLSGIPFYTNTLTAENVLETIDITAMGVTYGGNEDKSDEFIANSINESLKSKDYATALKYLDEAIRRNPYRSDLYQIRIMVNTRLGDKDRVMDDVNKVAVFINGKSMKNVLEGN